MKHIIPTILAAGTLALLVSPIYAADRPDLSDITMDVIHSEDAREITHEIELPELEHDRHESTPDSVAKSEREDIRESNEREDSHSTDDLESPDSIEQESTDSRDSPEIDH